MTPDATIYDVARQAGVSISTVSLAINHPERVKDATRQKVLAAADQIGFVPKERAVARARAGVGRIAVVAPFTSYPSYGRRLSGMFKQVNPEETQLLVIDHEDIAMSRSPFLESFPVRGHVDGLIIMGVPVEEKTIDRLIARVPAVLVDTRNSRLPSIWVDDFAGGQMVGARFRGWGHARVAFVRETEVSYLKDSPTQQRLDGLKSVMGSENVIEVTVSRSEHAGAEAVASLWSNERPWHPTAVFANRDLVALSLIAALRASGRRVPEDVSVVGFDDDPAAAAIGLSTISNPLEESGERAIQIVRDLMARSTIDAKAPLDVELPILFKDRSTAGPRS